MALVDRIALGLFCLVALALFALGGLGPNPHFLDAEWWQAWIHSMFLIGLEFIVPIWAVLRLLDLMSGGPARRRGRFIVYPLN